MKLLLFSFSEFRSQGIQVSQWFPRRSLYPDITVLNKVYRIEELHLVDLQLNTGTLALLCIFTQETSLFRKHDFSDKNNVDVDWWQKNTKSKISSFFRTGNCWQYKKVVFIVVCSHSSKTFFRPKRTVASMTVFIGFLGTIPKLVCLLELQIAAQV